MKYLIWLQSVLNVGNNRAKDILKHFGGAENIYKADYKEILSSGLFKKSELERIKDKNLTYSLEIIEDCKKNGIEIIPFGSSKYPYCLSVIEDAPLILYVKGNMPDFDKTPTISIVGPRKISDFGKKAAFSLSFRLAKSGFCIVSGGALGGDTYAHAGAIKAKGKTVIVLGCGILNDYLPQNKALRKEVAINGALISEFPPRAEATKYTFPIRNRIVSALSLGTVVIEASSKSGALITARHAAEQGRDVFVIPGQPDKKEYIGSNALLRDGAKPILDVSDIFGEYIVRFPDKINIENAFKDPILDYREKTDKKIEKNLPEGLSKEAKIVYNYLDKQKFLPEEVLGCGIETDSIISALTELEMEMLIKAIPGGMYEKL